jgi:outer membrane protein OmpA-like peptidoglycan-associated protein
VIEEPGRRTIIRENNRVIIRQDPAERLRRFDRNARVERRGNQTVTIVRRPGGVEIITVVDERGRLVRRVRRVGGREFVLINTRYRDPTRIVYFVNLPPPRIVIPREQYIVDFASAPPPMLVETLAAPPVEALPQEYELEEVLQSPDLRARVRRIDLDVRFDTGSWELGPEQLRGLERLANAIKQVLERNPNEVFLIEGHTDAVGTEEDNLSLSDRRAEEVAVALTEEFGVPPENLVTRGYGESELKVPTDGPEALNRRVTVRRITPLVAQAR